MKEGMYHLQRALFHINSLQLACKIRENRLTTAFPSAQATNLELKKEIRDHIYASDEIVNTSGDRHCCQIHQTVEGYHFPQMHILSSLGAARGRVHEKSLKISHARSYQCILLANQAQHQVRNADVPVIIHGNPFPLKLSSDSSRTEEESDKLQLPQCPQCSQQHAPRPQENTSPNRPPKLQAVD